MKEAWLIAPWVVLPFVSLGIISRLLKRSWLAPGAFFVLYWSAATVVPLIFSPYEKVSIWAISWIFLSSLVVFFGDIAGAAHKPYKQLVKSKILFSVSQISFIRTVIIFCSFVGIISFAIIFYSAAQGTSLVSIQDFVAVARKIAVSRNTRMYKPFLTQFLNMFLYAGPLFAGVLSAIENRRRYLIIAALPFLPALLMTVVFTKRGFIILSIMLWISSYLATRVLVGKYQLFTKRHLFSGLVFVSLLSIVVVVAGTHRWEKKDKGSIGVRSYAQIRHVAFRHVAVFSHWFDREGLEMKIPLPGAYTFAGVFDLLRIRKREIGLFNENVIFPDGRGSNIYTIFRVLIEDFTPLGSFVVLFLIAFLASRMYQQVDRGSARAMPVLVAFYATVLGSFITSIWIWNSIIAAFVLFTTGFLVMLDLHTFKSRMVTLWRRFQKRSLFRSG